MHSVLYRTAVRHFAVVVIWLHGSIIHAATPSSSAASFSGYVTESSGVNGIDGAVVSVEWIVELSDAGQSTRSKPTVLAVWQARTDAEGAFRIHEDRIKLPRGVTPAPDAFPRLQVFAIGHEPYRVSGLSRGVSVGDGGRISIKWPEGMTVIRVIQTPESQASVNAQFEAWHAELKQALQKEIWPRGEKQALTSYRPLMELVSESCLRYHLYFGAPAPACERIRDDFALKYASEAPDS
jgi:hypothetical protein